MPVSKPIAGVKITSTLSFGSLWVSNARGGVLDATVGDMSALGVAMAYVKGTAITNGSLSWDLEEYKPPPATGVGLAFGTIQMVMVPSIGSV